MAAELHSQVAEIAISRDKRRANPQLDTTRKPARVPIRGPSKPMYFVAATLTTTLSNVAGICIGRSLAIRPSPVTGQVQRVKRARNQELAQQSRITPGPASFAAPTHSLMK